MKDGSITDFHGSFDDFLEFSANENKTVLPVTEKRKKKKPAITPKQLNVKKISVETLIYEAETELGKINAEIEAGILDADYERLKPLYEKKHGLEEQIETLYNEWANESENGGRGDA